MLLQLIKDGSSQLSHGRIISQLLEYFGIEHCFQQSEGFVQKDNKQLFFELFGESISLLPHFSMMSNFVLMTLN